MTVKRRSYFAIVATILAVSCGRAPATDAVLTLRQLSLGTAVEMAIGDTQINVIVKEKTRIIERTAVKISPEESAKIRGLFWDALRDPPTERLTPTRDLVFEQEWRGPARSYQLTIQGPLTSAEYRAYDHLNRLVPARYRFLVDYGPQRRPKR
jgi:hypothetical protein